MKKSLSSLSSLSVKTIGWIGSPMNRNFSGSMSLVTIKRTSWKIYNILIDCWMSKISDGLFYNNWINPKDIDLILLTHAHIDHIWLLPYFADNNNWFTWKLIATNETLKLAQIMLNDSVNLNKEVNRETIDNSQWSQLLNESLELYLKKEKAVLASMLTMSSLSKSQRIILTREKQEIKEYLSIIENSKDIYNITINNTSSFYNTNNINWIFQWRNIYTLEDLEEFEVVDWVIISLVNSAHILWSSQFLIKVEDGNWWNYNLWFSWDVWKYKDNNLWYPKVFDEKLDFYMIESTYGCRVHNNQFDKLIAFIEEVAVNWGKIFIPVFMLQRFQDVALKIIKLQRHYKSQISSFINFSDLPIYVDWSQIQLINSIFKESIYYDTYKELFHSNKIKYISWESSNNKFNGNCWWWIVFASWWMMQWWWIKKYMQFLKKSHNGLVFTGYQWEMTTWRKILDWTEFDDNKLWWVSSFWCRVFNWGFFSSHWDQNDLITLLDNTKFSKNPTIITNHGIRCESQLDLLAKAIDNKAVPASSNLLQSWVNREINLL